MGTVRSNNISVKLAREATPGTIPTTAGGIVLMEPNAVPDIGADLTLVPRTPISKNRQERQGDVVDLDSKLSIEADLTLHHLRMLIPAAVFAELTSVNGGTTGGKALGAPFYPTSVTATAYVVDADGALVQGTLIKATGFVVAGNNGVKVVGAASDADEIKTSGLAAETVNQPTRAATVEICGFQFATGDLEVDTDGSLKSTVKDFTDFGLLPGMGIHLGDDSDAAYSFTTANDYGFARVLAVTAHKITVDKTDNTWAMDAGAAKTIRLLFGPWGRNVDVDHASWVMPSYTAEVEYPNLYSPDPGWQYSVGNVLDELVITLPLSNKATIRANFVGMDTEEVTDTEETNWDAPREPRRTQALNSSSRMKRLRIASGSSDITAYFKGLTLTFKNNVNPNKVIGQLGALDMNFGLFQVSFESQAVFTNGDLVSAVRANTTLTFDFAMRNNDGGFWVDIPSCYLGSAKPDAPVNEAVLVAVNGRAFQDTTFGYSVSVTYFPYLPATSSV